MKLLDSGSIFFFFRDLHTVLHSGCTSSHSSPKVYKSSPFSTSSPACVTHGPFDDGHFDGCEIPSHCGFDLHSSDDQ